MYTGVYWSANGNKMIDRVMSDRLTVLTFDTIHSIGIRHAAGRLVKEQTEYSDIRVFE